MFSFLIASIGLIFLLTLSAYGSSAGLCITAASTTFYAQKRSLITKAYVASLFSSTIFILGFIISMLIMFKISDNMKLEHSFKYLVSGTIYGFSGYFVGNAMGEVSKLAFEALSKDEGFFTSFLIQLTSLELLVIFAFALAVIIMPKA
ncbi:V-type ATP synthase subunit K [Spraguea lophii 42_110]|uniref:V-type ATP synthase subunit K n=1 Tax=Spraguea lophii (strain 42_110) TaxID=1358809 RepID=S7W4N7_SPRLO|nr:V-type ATP synthase subunit K [Spraguea lophii 42_110]